MVASSTSCSHTYSPIKGALYEVQTSLPNSDAKAQTNTNPALAASARPMDGDAAGAEGSETDSEVDSNASLMRDSSGLSSNEDGVAGCESQRCGA